MDINENHEGPPGWARWISRISFVAAIIAMTITIWTVGPRTIYSHLGAIGWWFAAVIAVEGIATLFDARAIYEFACRPGEPFGRVLFAQIAGRAVNSVTPFGALGEATKASILTRIMPTRRAVAAVIFYDFASVTISLIALTVGALLTALTLQLPAALEYTLYATSAVAAATTVGLILLVKRGMLSSLVALGVRLRLVPRRKRRTWQKKLDQIDQQVRGSAGDPARRRAFLLVLASKATTWAQMWLILAAAGFQASFGELIAILTGGVVLGWVAQIVPLGAGVTESGNYAIFTAIGAPASFGVALALARRVNQIVYAAIGFTLLAAWQMSTRAFALGRK